MTVIKPCPFCGHIVELDNSDTLYPSGTGWKFDEDLQMKTYHNFREVPKEQWCYTLHCVLSSGGCGSEMHGDSREECIAKWNHRVS